MTIEFDPTSTPIMGWLVGDKRPRQEFQGMLELISLVEAARRAARSDAAASGSPDRS